MTVQLPKMCGSRETARELIMSIGNEKTPYIDASNVASAAQGFIDELCAALVAKRIDRVTVINPSENMKKHLMLSYMLRNAKFSLEYFVR